MPGEVAGQIMKTGSDKGIPKGGMHKAREERAIPIRHESDWEYESIGGQVQTRFRSP